MAAPAVAPAAAAAPTDAPVAQAPAAANAAAPAAAGAAAANAAHAHQSASLHCSGLTQEVNEGMLYEVFKAVGSVASIRVCRDTVTRRSLGYAYINFHNVQDADRALTLYNFHLLNGKPIYLSWSMRDPTLRKSGVGNIFIKNLDKEIDDKALHDVFSEFGTILSCKVMTDEKGASRGFGFVHFEKAESAQTAIDKLNQMLLNDKQVYVGHHVSKRERASKVEETKKNFTNVYVKFVDASVSDEVLQAAFAKYGEITSCKIARDAADASKGFGFVNFAEHQAAQRAVEELHNSEFHGKKLYVTRAQKRAERSADLQRRRMERQQKTQESNVYVKNLDDSVTDDRLRQEFAPFGTITSAKVITDDKGISRGFGFVCFAEADEANKAINAMQNKTVGSKPLYLAIAMRKDQRRAMLEAQHSQRAAMPPNQQGMMPGMVPVGYYPGVPRYMYPNVRHRSAPTGAPANMGRAPYAMPGYQAGPAAPRGHNAMRQPRRPPMTPQQYGPGAVRPFPAGAKRSPTFTAEQLADGANRQELGNYFYGVVFQHVGGDQQMASQATGILLTAEANHLVTMQNSLEALTHGIDESLKELTGRHAQGEEPQQH